MSWVRSVGFGLGPVPWETSMDCANPSPIHLLIEQKMSTGFDSTMRQVDSGYQNNIYIFIFLLNIGILT